MVDVVDWVWKCEGVEFYIGFLVWYCIMCGVCRGLGWGILFLFRILKLMECYLRVDVWM